MGLELVPIGYRGKVVLQRQVTPFALPAQTLDGYAQIFLKANGIVYVPTLLAETALGALVWHVVKARVEAAETVVDILAVFPALAVAIGAAEVVFLSRTTDGGEWVVAVNVELDLPFTPPALAVRTVG